MSRPSLNTRIFVFLCLVWVTSLLLGCQPAVSSAVSSIVSPTGTAVSKPLATILPSPSQTAVRLDGPPATPTSIPTTTASPTPIPSATPTATNTFTPTPTATPIGPCTERIPGDDLLTIITLEYSLSRNYTPSDLVPLSDYLPVEVTLGYPTEVQEIMVDSLVQMIQDMQAAGLAPFIISGYRSYASQSIAWNKWLEKEPDRASILSAPPGFSEHQLGTTLDFGSPELAGIINQEDVEFHTYFFKTSESQWLAENSHKYGFTLSYPREAFDLTGFYYEPWHYRYVGVELATRLKEANTFLTQYQFETQPIPCIP